MSKVKITINNAQSSVKINDQEINDIVANLSVNIRATEIPTITMTLAPCSLEINGESYYVKPLKSTPEKTI